MAATRFIPVSQETYDELVALKRPDRSFDDLLAGLVETRKKHRFARDMDRIRSRGTFAVFDP